MDLTCINDVVIYVTLTADYKIIMANDLFCQFIGRPVNEGESILDLSAAYQLSGFVNDLELDDIFRNVNRNPDKFYQFDWLWITKRSTDTFGRVKVKKQNDEYVWIIQDLNDIVKDYNILKDQYYIVNQSLESFHQLFYITDTKNCLIKANKFFLKMFDIDEADVGGKTMDELMLKHCDEIIKTSNFTIRLDTFEKNDKKYWFKNFCYNILNQDGVPYAYSNISIDITKEKNLQEEVDVAKAQNIAKSRLAMLGEMAGGIAHEINNPLAIIATKTSMIEKFYDKKMFDDKRILESTKSIKDITNRISVIIKALRKISRDGSDDDFEEFQIENVIDDVLHICLEKIKKHEIELDIDLDAAKNIPLYGQIVQMSQVFINLISNAIDAIDGPGKIELNTKLKDDFLIITFKDSGKGIPKEIQEKIFQPFFTTKDVGKGTGLGLSLSKSIIEAHKGSLNLDLNDSKSTFVITLPVYKKE
ncbi:MAG: PAS domain-containing protein [Halobacteriovoraceae bacterium]|nr:PAS domain-containing protein [Halobacteriovoraceae bacterium]